jgi:hypothetical protein
MTENVIDLRRLMLWRLLTPLYLVSLRPSKAVIPLVLELDDRGNGIKYSCFNEILVN